MQQCNNEITHISATCSALCYIFLIVFIFTNATVIAGGLITEIVMDGKSISIHKSNQTNELEDLIKKKITNKGDSTKSTWSEIKKISQEYGLFNIGGFNFGLKMQDGTVGYWHDQHLGKTEYQIQLLARKIVLDSANNQKTVIGDVGKLSFVAERLIQEIVKKVANTL